MIDLHGAEVCSVEHADATIGGQMIIDAQEQNGYLHLQFENGASLPLTCPCCGGQLHLRELTLDDLSQMIAGRRVEGFRHGQWVNHETPEQRHPIFALQFNGDEDVSVRTIQVHLESVSQITERASDRADATRLI